MKKSDTLIAILGFIIVNLIALYIISKFFNMAYGIATCTFAGVIFALDFSKRRRNMRILKEQRKQMGLNPNVNLVKQQRNARNMRDAERKRKFDEQVARRNQMREHNNYRRKK